MGKSKRTMKKWGGDPGAYGAAPIGVDPNDPGSTSTTRTTTVNPGANAEKGFFSDAVDTVSNTINSLNPFASTTVDDLKKKKADKSAECDGALKAIDAEIAAAAPQQGGRRRKRSHKKRSRRSRRSKRSRRHR